MRPVRASLMIGMTLAMIAMLAISAAPSHAANPYKDAASYWSFNDQNDPLKDYGVKQNVLTPSGGALWGANSGKSGGAYTLDGYKDYFYKNYDANDGLHPANAPFTVSAWFKTSAYPPVQQMVVSVGYGGNWPSYYLGLNEGQNPAQLVWFTGPMQNVATFSDGYVNNGIWHHAVGVYDGSEMRLYVDGILQDTAPKSGSLSVIESFRIGHMNGTPDRLSKYYFEGVIDEVGVWNRALSATPENNEIATLRNMGLIGGGVLNTFGLSYDTAEIGMLADLYAAADPDQYVTIDGVTWRYVYSATGLPDQGTHVVGDAWLGSDNNEYILMHVGSGSGLQGSGGTPDGDAPEPSSVIVAAIAAIAGAVWRRVRGRAQRT